MATKASMVTEIGNFFNKIINLFTKTGGNTGNGLYFDNSEGTFSFYNDYMVPYMQIATTPTELAGAKAAVVGDVARAGIYVVDGTSLQIHTYDQGTNTWTASPTNYYSWVRQTRVYYSPWNAYVWTTDKYGEFKRFMTTGLTLIG
jgi:hypothetical protein